jgi:hypothetical protein
MGSLGEWNTNKYVIYFKEGKKRMETKAGYVNL